MSRVRLFGSLCGLVFLVNLARIVFAPLVGEFIDEFAIREGTAGLIVTLAWVGSASPRIPTGWLLTRVPRHYVVVGAGGILTAASALIATASTVRAVMIGAFCMGLASGIYFVSANPLLSELFPDLVGRVMGVHGMVSQTAAVAAAPIVTLALLYDWRAVFVGIGIAAATATVVIVALSVRTDLPTAGREDTAFLDAAISQWRLILTGAILLGCTGFLWQGLFNFYELYLRSKGLSPGIARNLLTVIFAAGVPAFFVSGRLVDRFPHVPYVLSIVACFTGLVLLLTIADGLVAVAVLTAAIGFVMHAVFPAMDTYLLENLPDESRASAYSMYSGGMTMAQAGGSSGVGLLVERGFAYDTVFVGFASVLAAILVAFAVLARIGRLPGTEPHVRTSG